MAETIHGLTVANSDELRLMGGSLRVGWFGNCGEVTLTFIEEEGETERGAGEHFSCDL